MVGLAKTFDTHIKAISIEQEWANYKAMVNDMHIIDADKALEGFRRLGRALNNSQPTLAELDKRYTKDLFNTKRQRPRKVYGMVIDEIHAVGEPTYIRQRFRLGKIDEEIKSVKWELNEDNTMKYKVKTDLLKGYNKGDKVRAIDMNGRVFPCLKSDIKGINEEIIERNPDWFQPVEQVKEGQYWAWNENDVVFRVQKCKSNQCEVRPLERNSNGYASKKEIVSDARKLSTHEIEEALLKEFNRRGYNKSTKFKDADDGVIGKHFKLHIDNIHYDKTHDWLCDGWGNVVYRKGNWAEIVDQTPHIEINGKQIEVEDGTVKISCGDTIEEEMFKNFYAVVNKYDLDVSRNGEQINEQLQKIWDEMPNKIGETVSWSIEIDGSEIDWGVGSGNVTNWARGKAYQAGKSEALQELKDRLRDIERGTCMIHIGEANRNYTGHAR